MWHLFPKPLRDSSVIKVGYFCIGVDLIITTEYGMLIQLSISVVNLHEFITAIVVLTATIAQSS